MFTYVVTSYRDPEHLFRLLGRMRAGSPAAQLVVSHDRKSEPLDAAVLRAVGAEQRRTPTPVNWGDETYLHSILSVLRDLRLGEQDWVTLLSAADYPLRPVADYERHRKTFGADMMLEVTTDESLLGRYRSHGHRVPRWAARGSVGRVVNRVPGLSWQHQPHGLAPRIEVRHLRTPFHEAFTIRKGADLFALNGRALGVLLSAPPSLLRYYDRCAIPSESYPHTVLLNDPTLVNEPTLLHFSRWAASAHPEWLESSDLPAMLASECWFGRKFRPGAPVLDELDRILA